MGFEPNRPYNDLPLLPPKAELESHEVLKKAIAAHKALAELKGMLNTIPNPAMLINTIVFQEAKSSSLIENVVTTNDKLYQSAAVPGNPTDPHTKEVLNYRQAIWEGHRQLLQRQVLSTNLFIQIVQTIKGTSAGIRKIPGTAIVSSSGQIIYTPPEGERVIREKLGNLEEFIHDEANGMDVLVKMAVIHYQFEAIHPFADGNGRTGRIINILYLVLQNLIPLPVLYLSKFIIENKENYYRLLRNVTEKEDWQPWIFYMLEGMEQTAGYTVKLVEGIRSLLEKTAEKIKKDLPKIYSRELVNVLFDQPYCRIQNIVEAGLASRNTASKYMKAFEDIGILELHKVWKENLYLNKKLWSLLKRS